MHSRAPAEFKTKITGPETLGGMPSSCPPLDCVQMNPRSAPDAARQRGNPSVEHLSKGKPPAQPQTLKGLKPGNPWCTPMYSSLVPRIGVVSAGLSRTYISLHQSLRTCSVGRGLINALMSACRFKVQYNTHIHTYISGLGFIINAHVLCDATWTWTAAECILHLHVLI